MDAYMTDLLAAVAVVLNGVPQGLARLRGLPDGAGVSCGRGGLFRLRLGGDGFVPGGDDSGHG